MTSPLSTETKVQALRAQIYQLATQRGPGEKLPTVRELCEMFHASRVSLYEALDELEAQHVLYREQSKGIFVSPKIHRKSICILLDVSLLLSTGSSPFWGMLWGHIAALTEQRVQVKNEYYSMHIVPLVKHDEPRLPEEVEALIRSGRIHGVLAVGFPAAFNEWIIKQQIPCVTFAEGGYWMVKLNMVEMIRLAVKSLLEQECRTIGLWRPVFWQNGNLIETQAYENLFASLLTVYGGQFQPEQVKIVSPNTFQSSFPITFQEQGYQLALRFFSHPEQPKPDGLIITDEMMTDGLLAAFQTLGIRVGEDIKIATHANKGLMKIFRHMKGMTVIEFDPEEIVHAMFSLLDQLLAGQMPAQQTIDIMPRFFVP